MSRGLLRPLGRPGQNSTKYFATAELLELRHDVKWLARATDAVQERWRLKNRKKGNPACIRDGRTSRSNQPFEDRARSLTASRPTRVTPAL
ncbi:MAG TPA: hypothetical protein DCE44_15885 [Verrucomicrobiales bacterium]|nr:hypothetical protein [Verrucomicrobiales bacterium]